MNYKQLNDYRSIFFDCDGVILNSNSLKTNAFFKSAEPWGQKEAKKLEQYHIQHGGISRYEKFRYFLKEIVGHPPATESDFETLLQTYKQILDDGLSLCEMDKGIYKLKSHSKEAVWHVVSGGDEKELRNLFSKRDISSLFAGGIFGSPENKYQIFSQLLTGPNSASESLFIGDSLYDYEVAKHFGLDFIFVTHWTDFEDWETFFRSKGISCVDNLEEIINLLQ